MLFTPTESSKAFLFNRVLEFTPCNIFDYHYMIHPKILPYNFKLNFSLVMFCNGERNAVPQLNEEIVFLEAAEGTLDISDRGILAITYFEFDFTIS